MHTTRAILLLSKLAKSGRAPHALLFTGPDRDGKNKVAYEFAKWMLHDTRGDDFSMFWERGCGCALCREVCELRHPDFFAISDAVPSIQKIRGLKRHFSLSPFSTRGKVAVVTYADAMKKEAVNAFLKILEEPKGAALFILLACSRSGIAPTLSSRAVEIRFGGENATHAYAANILSRWTKTLEILEDPALYRRFDQARSYTLQNKDELIELLDAWLFKLRKDLGAPDAQKTLKSLKHIFAAQSSLRAGNSNPQLVLEQLLITI